MEFISKLSEIGKNLSLALGHIGVLDSDCLVEGSEFYVLELNARFGGQYPFSHLAGADIPKQIIDWYNGNVTNKGYISLKYNVLISKDIKPVLV